MANYKYNDVTGPAVCNAMKTVVGKSSQPVYVHTLSNTLSMTYEKNNKKADARGFELMFIFF